MTASTDLQALSNSSTLLVEPLTVPSNAPMFDRVPKEVLINIILPLLTAQGIAAFSSLSQPWNQLLKENDNIWQNLCENHLSSVPLNPFLNFQEAYKTFYFNLIKGVCALRCIKADSNVCSLAADDAKLFFGTSSGMIEIRDSETCVVKTILQGHAAPVCSLAIAKRELFSGDENGKIKVWDLETNVCTATLEGHKRSVHSLTTANGKLISGSEDKTTKIWNLETGVCEATLKAEGKALAAANGMLCSSSAKMIMIWDLNDVHKATILKGHEGRVQSLVFAKWDLISSDEWGTIKKWDLKNVRNTPPADLEGHKKGVRSLDVAFDKLVSGCRDCTIKIWNLETGYKATLEKQVNDDIVSLASARGKFFSRHRNQKNIVIWDLTADHDTIFEEIADVCEQIASRFYKEAVKMDGIFNPYLFHDHLNSNEDSLEELYKMSMCQLYKMPRSAINTIEEKYFEMFKMPLKECAWDVHKGKHELSTYQDQIAQAIRAYLRDQPSRLLSYLGIHSRQECYDKLKCWPEHLQKAGILTLDDLEFICSLSNFNKIPIVDVVQSMKEDLAETKKRMEKLKGSAQELLKITDKKMNEIKRLKSFEAAPWAQLQQALNAFQVKLQEIEKPDGFSCKDYNALIGELNAQIDAFQSLDRDLQIAKLKAYLVI